MLAELMLPEGAHLREQDYTVFMVSKKTLEGFNPPEVADGEEPPLLYALNLVRTKMDSTVRRGAIVKALCICTPYRFFHVRFFSCCELF